MHGHATARSGPSHPYTHGSTQPSPSRRLSPGRLTPPPRPPSLSSQWNMQRCAKYNARMASVENMMDVLNERLEEKETLAATLDRTIKKQAACEKEKAEAIAELAEEKARSDGWQEDAEKAREGLERVSKEKDGEAKLADLKSKEIKRQHEAEIEELGCKVSERTAASEALQLQIDKLKEHLETAQNEVQRSGKKLSEAEELSTQMNAEIGVLRRELSQHKATSESLQLQIEDIRKHLEAAQDEVQRLGNQISGTRNIVAQQEAEIERLRRELSHHQEESEPLQHCINELQEQLRNKDQIILEINLKATTSDEATANAKKELKNSKGIMARKEAKVAKLEEQLVKAEKKHADYEDTLRKMGGTKSIRALQAHHEVIYEQKSREVVVLERQLNDPQTQIGAIIKERDDFRTQAENKEKSNQQLLGMFMVEQKHVEQLQQEYRKQKQEIARLKEQLDNDMSWDPSLDLEEVDRQFGIRPEDYEGEARPEADYRLEAHHQNQVDTEDADEDTRSEATSSTLSNIVVAPRAGAPATQPATADNTPIVAPKSKKSGTKRKVDPMDGGEPETSKRDARPEKKARGPFKAYRTKGKK